MSDAFTTLSDALATVGVSLIERTRLTFGAPVLAMLVALESALRESEQDTTRGRVYVATDAAGIAAYRKLAENIEGLDTFVKLFDATGVPAGTSHSQVKSHVVNYAKSRKIQYQTNPVKSGDDIVGFSLSRKTP